MSKKGFVWLLAMILLLSTACGGGTSPDDAAPEELEGEVTVWAWNVAAQGLEAVVPLFNETYPNIQVKVEDVGRLDVYEKTTVGLAARGAGLPDVITIESDRLPNYIAQFPDGLANLSEYGADEYKDKISESKWEEATLDGSIYAMPWDIGPAGVFYRTDLFEEAGVNPDEIETWDDFIAAGKVIKEKTGTKLLPIDVAADDALFRMMLNQQGVYYFDADGNIDIHSPEAVKAMETIKQMQEEDLVVNAKGWDGTVTATTNGDVATVPFGVWYAGTIMDQAPDLSGKWDAFPLPAFEEGGNRAANLGGSNLVVNGHSDDAELAWKFVEFAMTNKEAQMVMMKEYGLFPSLLEAYEDPFFQEPVEYFGNQPIYQMFADQVADIPPAYYTEDYARALKRSSDAQASILLDDADVEKALKEAADALAKETSREVK